MRETIYVIRAGTPDDLNGSARYLERLIQSRRSRHDRLIEHRLPRGASVLESSTREKAHRILREADRGQLVVVEAAALPAFVYALSVESARRLCVLAVFHRSAYSEVSTEVRDRVFAAERDAYRGVHRVVTSSLHGAMALGPKPKVLEFSAKLSPRRPPRGVHRFSSIEELNRHRERWRKC
ncbi:MAG: hypothetical protein AAF219_10255 [Myxococcota bacterium]